MLEEKQNTGTEEVLQLRTHMFFLKRAETQSSSFVQVDFSPTAFPSASPAACASFNIHPTFNLDRLHYTPAFILPLDSLKTAEHQEAYLRLHNQKRAEMNDQREELLVPRPSKANSFCCICKKTFDDYLTHISMPFHQQLLEGSSFRQDILQLSLHFNAKAQQPKQERRNGKNRKIKKGGRKAKSEKNNHQQNSSTLCNQNSFEQKQIAV